jgi:hypothetical protein
MITAAVIITALPVRPLKEPKRTRKGIKTKPVRIQKSCPVRPKKFIKAGASIVHPIVLIMRTLNKNQMQKMPIIVTKTRGPERPFKGRGSGKSNWLWKEMKNEITAITKKQRMLREKRMFPCSSFSVEILYRKHPVSNKARGARVYMRIKQKQTTSPNTM